ncbi:EF-hand calcium-binding domain-containing protein 12 [Heteronotia binoei]|uniref:EF-hand calcium-binding domain-containing protein 12 n=1 Tax=Heteronotia binoei TaxID=13085 RepID=UPI00293109A1|nr:EF-hand calcium-binding domain-containing protein 12 [Heteronotia binoei]
MSDKEPLKENSELNLDGFIQHCFKRYKLRERHPKAFLKLKPSRFGPAPPRCRILIPPPMEGVSFPRAKLLLPERLDQKQETFAVKEELKEVAKIPTEEDEVRELGAWIEERKKFQNLLNKCADVESWLMGKEYNSEQEVKVLRKIRESRKLKKAQVKAQLTATSSIEQLLPVRKPKRIIPLIKSPYPESLINLQNLLHKQKLKLVDVFNKEDRTKSMKFRRADFIRVIEGTKVPISKNDLEDVVIYLTSMKKGNYITNSDLMECQRLWMDYLKEQWKHPKEAKPEDLLPTDQKVGPGNTKWLSSGYSKSKIVTSQKRKSNHLEVPPINTELDRMHLSYIKMEEVGKRYREVRRQRKRKINPLEWAENCRVVKSGDPVVDRHCMPSTVTGDMGELVDQHRMACHLAWFQCVKLCEQYGVPLTEKLLKRALLYPGDKLLSYGGTRQKIRQPGGYYEAWDRRRSVSESVSELEEQPKSPSREKERFVLPVFPTAQESFGIPWLEYRYYDQKLVFVIHGFSTEHHWEASRTEMLNLAGKSFPLRRAEMLKTPEKAGLAPSHSILFWPLEQEPEPKKREREEKPIWGRWRSYSEFRNLMRRHSKRLQLAAQNLWDEKSVESISESQVQFENRFIEREMRKMFGFLNPKTDANSFWPGHLLDKLRLYLPQMEHDGEALFSHVTRTCPVYPAIYHPHRNWPVSEQKFVTYGNPDSQKNYYYI